MASKSFRFISMVQVLFHQIFPRYFFKPHHEPLEAGAPEAILLQDLRLFMHDGQTSGLLLQMTSIAFILFLRYKNLLLDEGEVYFFLVCLKISYEMFLHTSGILQVTGLEVSLNIFPFSLLSKMRCLDLRRLFGISTFIFLSITDLKISNTFLSSEQILQITIVCNLARLSKDISILIVYTGQ